MDIRPGEYVLRGVTSSGAPLKSAADFIGRPITRDTALEAQAAVDQLRDYAVRLRQYTVLRVDDDGTEVRAYYGEAGQALHNAEEIRRVVNDNLHNYYSLRDLFIR